jgi:hypothetical protein
MWFKNAYDRAEAAEYVIKAGQERGLAEEYHPGYFRTSWQIASLGGAAILLSYPQRMVFNADLGQDEPVATPFFRVHGPYLGPVGDRIDTMIEFDRNYAYLKRSTEYAKGWPDRRGDTDVWDEAMAGLDQSLLTHAVHLGWGALAEVVTLQTEVPREQFVFVTAA